MENIDPLDNFGNVHYPAGIVHQYMERYRAQRCMKTNELEAIHHLVESHVPGLRTKAVLRYEKASTYLSSTGQVTLHKNHVELSCPNTPVGDNISRMLEKVQQMPPEWTLVQLTPHYNPHEDLNLDENKHFTNALYLTVFNCGENQPKPFCVDIKAPTDGVTGAAVEIMDDIHSIMTDNLNLLMLCKGKSYFTDVAEKEIYYGKRHAIDNHLKALVRDLQDLYLREWKCFFVGKYDREIEAKIQGRIRDFFKTEVSGMNLDEKTAYIMTYLVKSAPYLKLPEVKRALQTLVPPSLNAKLQKDVLHFVRGLYDELSLNRHKRHPLILIIDDSLDSLPWEMMDILADAQVSRLPSLHIAYGLYQEHKASIKDGFKILKNPERGSYVLNPDLDLTRMENRIMSFYEFWLPDWKGIAGVRPSEEEFEKLLLSGNVFAYNGHGSGAQFYPLQKIESLRIDAVVFLFGCSSSKLNSLGPTAERYGTHQMYFIACSPCVVGNLWEITDLESDNLNTVLLTTWIPSSRNVRWSDLAAKIAWRRGEKVNFVNEDFKGQGDPQVPEPELLKALSRAKKSSIPAHYITKAGLVARGIPIKIHVE